MAKKTGAGKETVNTVVGKDSVLEGRFEVSDGIRVDGTLKGVLISSGALIVGTSGQIEADPIRVKDAIVGGRVKGKLEASHLVRLEASAEMIGDISAQVLVIEEGAVLHGVCNAGRGTDMPLPQKGVAETVEPAKVKKAVG